MNIKISLFASVATSMTLLGATLPVCSAPAEPHWQQDVKSCAAPEYPRESASKGEQGTTGLRILVGVDGRAIDSEVESSSHSHKLDSAAQRALMQCSFKPQPADTKPAQQWVKTEFVWKLN